MFTMNGSVLHPPAALQVGAPESIVRQRLYSSRKHPLHVFLSAFKSWLPRRTRGRRMQRMQKMQRLQRQNQKWQVHHAFPNVAPQASFIHF